MPTSTRTRRSSAATTGRFSRPSSPRLHRHAPGRRPAVPQRRGLAGGWLQRRKPQKQSRLTRVLGGLGGALPGRAKRQSSSTTKGGRRSKVGGLALLAGAAGLMFKNRDKVASMTRPGAHRSTPGSAPTNVGGDDLTPRS